MERPARAAGGRSAEPVVLRCLRALRDCPCRQADLVLAARRHAGGVVLGSWLGHFAKRRADARIRLGGCAGDARHRRGHSAGRTVRLAARRRYPRARMEGRPLAMGPGARARAKAGTPAARGPAGRPRPMKAIYDVPAPAKLNLFLHVVGRRADGYHLLQSAFMLIDWCDTLHFELRPDGALSREDLADALPADDLVLRAARALQAAAPTAHGAHIAIEKRLPAQAGLGGGSSDAATCLLALNRLWGLGLSATQLSRIGLTLGADVPFFLGGRNAWVEGVGDQLAPLALPAAR